MIIALDESYRNASAGRLSNCELRYFDGPKADRQELLSLLNGAEVLAVRRPFPFFVDREFIQQLSSLQVVHKSGSGVDGFDLQALSECGILLANNHGVNAACVAEHALLLTLLCLRNTYPYFNRMREGLWKQEPPTGGVLQLEGKRIGIIGMGPVGQKVAKRVAAFDAQVLAYRRKPGLEIETEVNWVELDQLLSESDVVILCVSLNDQTRGMIGARELGLMKKGSVLINVARGPVVDEAALYDALTTGHLRAAGLDVFSAEPTPSDNPLLKLENVLATPHIAGRSLEMEHNQIEATMKDLERVLSGQRPRNVVNAHSLEPGNIRAAALR